MNNSHLTYEDYTNTPTLGDISRLNELIRYPLHLIKTSKTHTHKPSLCPKTFPVCALYISLLKRPAGGQRSLVNQSEREGLVVLISRLIIQLVWEIRERILLLLLPNTPQVPNPALLFNHKQAPELTFLCFLFTKVGKSTSQAIV